MNLSYTIMIEISSNLDVTIKIVKRYKSKFQLFIKAQSNIWWNGVRWLSNVFSVSKKYFKNSFPIHPYLPYRPSFLVFLEWLPQIWFEGTSGYERSRGILVQTPHLEQQEPENWQIFYKFGVKYVEYDIFKIKSWQSNIST